MAVSNPREPVEFQFLLGSGSFPARLTRGQIVHEAFHAAFPERLRTGFRLTFRTERGDEVFADNFLGDVVDHFGTTRLLVTAVPIPTKPGAWRNLGFDHLAIAVADRPHARDFLRDVIQLAVMRDDPHLTVMASGSTALFLFDAGQDAPLSSGRPSSWHHLGFVVDDLEATYAHLITHRDRFASDFTMLERDERWSLYGFYRNGDVTFMIQFSEVKPAWRGITDPARSDFAGFLYDYASRPYGLQWDEDA